MRTLSNPSGPKLHRVSSGHLLGFTKVEERPEHLEPLGYGLDIAGPLYAARNFGDGVVFLYVQKCQGTTASGYGGKLEWIGWYRNTGSMWSSFGKTRLEAIEGAILDGWKYA